MTRRLSYTQISMFEECPYKWVLCYLKKQWPPKTWPLHFGGEVHNVVAVAIQKRSIEAALAHFKGWYLEDPEYGRRTACGLAESALRLIDQLKFDSIEVETSLPKSGSYGRSFMGILDVFGESRLYGTIILDWKVTTAEYTPHDLITNDQLTAYAYLYYQQYGQLPDRVGFAPLMRPDGFVSYLSSTRSAAAIEYWSKKVNDVQKEMANNVTRKNPNACEGKYGVCAFYEHCWKHDDNGWEVFCDDIPSLGRST